MKAVSVLQEAHKLHRRGIYLGTNAEDTNPNPAGMYFSPATLKHNWHVIGPSGTGKTFFLFWLFQILAFQRNSAVVIIDPKPSAPLFRKARDWAISYGLTKRLVLMDLTDQEVLTGYNPLKKNGLPPSVHAKAVREAIRSAWGAASFDLMPQLFRFLYLGLFVARLLEMTLVEAVELLRPGSSLRKKILPKISDPEARRGLEYLDALAERRQDELTASSIARLEAFVNDPFFRCMFTQKASLDIGEIIREQKIFLINLGTYNPTRVDDAKLLARFIQNDIIAHVFQNGSESRPVYLFLDEAHMLVSHDLCAALDMGRELGLHTIISHQFLHQLRDEDTSGYLVHSVLTDARVKVIFGNLPPEDLEILTKPIMVKTYNPWWVKDEIETLEVEPVETTRESTTTAHAQSQGRGLALPVSEAIGETDADTYGINVSIGTGANASLSEAFTKGKTRGRSKQYGVADTEMNSWSESESEGDFDADGDSVASGVQSASDSGVTMLPDGTSYSYHDTAGQTLVHSQSHQVGRSTMRASSVGGGSAHTESFVEGEHEAESESKTDGITRGVSLALGLGGSLSHMKGTQRTASRGLTPSVSEERSQSISRTIQPFHELHKRRVVSSRTFMTPEEQALLIVQRAQAQPLAHFLAVTPDNTHAYIRAPWIKEPRTLPRMLSSALEQIHNLPHNTRVNVLALENGEDKCISLSTPTDLKLECEEQRARTERIQQQPRIVEAEIAEPIEPTIFRHKKKPTGS